MSFNRKDLDHINYENKLKLLPMNNRCQQLPTLSEIPEREIPKSRGELVRKTVITPKLDFNGFRDKQMFSPFNFNWSVRPRLTNKK